MNSQNQIMLRKLSLIIYILLALGSSTALAQQKFTLSGYVRDAKSGEELIGVTVYQPLIKTGVLTNTYGFYSITLPEGNYQLQFSYLGYEQVSKDIDLHQNRELNIDLSGNIQELSEVIVTDEAIDANVSALNMSRNKLDIQQLKKLPALLGEPDVIKMVQLLPGVISAGEGTSSFYVRGGSADQNLILIDEAPIYDPSHLFGIVSVFNADVIKDSELYKGGIPARFGGRLSSILDVQTKDGNNRRLGGVARLGLLNSGLMLEGPIKKEKSSFILSARRSNIDFYQKIAKEDNTVSFHDINAKVNWKPSNKNRIYVAAYFGRDVFDFGSDFGFDWGNKTVTLRWNHLFNERMFSNTSLIASNFDYGLTLVDPVQGFEWVSELTEYTFKEDLSYFINPRNELSAGYHVTYRKFSPGIIRPNDSNSIFKETKLQGLFALDHALYIGNQQKVNEKLSLKYGLRLSVFQNIGAGTVYTYADRRDNINIQRIDSINYDGFENIKTYINLEPRFAARYLLGLHSSLKFSYNRMVQNTHLISSGTVPIPFNTWHPSSPHLKPQLADQLTLGYFRNISNNSVELSAETYYKNMENVTDFADNASIFFNEDLATEFRQGRSWSYGLELMARKKEGLLSGFASYTWSKTQRDISGVNLNRTFFANHDRRHVFNVTAAYELNERWSLGGNFTYSTGRPLTIPAGRYEYGEGYNVDLITERNGYKLPPLHRMDVSATMTPKKNGSRKWKSSWVFALYNVYSRQNPFTVYTRLRQDEDGNLLGDGTEKEARLIYLFPILPSITYTIEF